MKATVKKNNKNENLRNFEGMTDGQLRAALEMWNVPVVKGIFTIQFYRLILPSVVRVVRRRSRVVIRTDRTA